MSRMRLLNESNGSSFEGFCIVKSVSVKTNVKGTEYLDFVFADCEGECAAKLWDYSRELHGVYDANDVVKVRGAITLWKDTEQLKIDKIRRVTPEDAVDMARLLPCSPFDPEWLYDELFTLAEHFADDDLRRLGAGVRHQLEQQLRRLAADFTVRLMDRNHAAREERRIGTETGDQRRRGVVRQADRQIPRAVGKAARGDEPGIGARALVQRHVGNGRHVPRHVANIAVLIGRQTFKVTLHAEVGDDR